MSTDTQIVILADDEKHVRRLAAMALARAGYTVVEAVDGEGALEALTRHAPTVRALVTDVCMPGRINGLELAALARELVPDISILVSSGTVEPGPGVLPTGGRFLRKPYSLRDLDEHLSAMKRSMVHAGPALAAAA